MCRPDLKAIENKSRKHWLWVIQLAEGWREKGELYRSGKLSREVKGIAASPIRASLQNNHHLVWAETSPFPNQQCRWAITFSAPKVQEKVAQPHPTQVKQSYISDLKKGEIIDLKDLLLPLDEFTELRELCLVELWYWEAAMGKWLLWVSPPWTCRLLCFTKNKKSCCSKEEMWQQDIWTLPSSICRGW